MPPVEAFILKWKTSGGSELGSSQLFITDLCRLIGLAPPDPPRPELADNSYVFERAVERSSATGRKSSARIDLWLKGRLIWESKQSSDRPTADNEGLRRIGTAVRGTASWDKSMLNARIQAQDYASILPENEKNPPFIIVADIGHSMDIYADFHQSGDYAPFPSAREHRILLEDFRKPEVRQLFHTIWTDPLSLDPSRESEKVTRALALKLAELAKSLEGAGQDPDTASLFVQRCIFLMFAEDCGLLPQASFTAFLARMEQKPDAFAPAMTELWQAMQHGGQSASLGAAVLRFHGYLFENAQALPLSGEQLAVLHEAARANWSGVDTSIFGALLECALSPQERHRLGAHFTPKAYVERLLLPTLIEPLREDWEEVKEAALDQLAQGQPQGAVETITAFHKALTEKIVLDPSCGSGNFLAVSLNLLKDLEGEVVQALRSLGLGEGDIQRSGLSIAPHQMRGIEIVQRAADISELVLWISYLQRHYKIYGKSNPPEPILRPARSVDCRDAVLAWDALETRRDASGKATVRFIHPRPADPWPRADFIVGNPPYIGNKVMRQALGDGYVEALRSAYPELPESIDYVMYWWHRSAVLARAGAVERFGLITTNKIRQTFNRRVVEQHVNAQPGLNILFAIPDHPWYDASQGGAQVRIAMTVCGMEQRQGVLAESILERREGEYIKVNLDSLRGKVNTGLTIDVDATKLLPLKSNAEMCSRGMTILGKGFIISQERAEKLGLGSIQGLDKHIKPYLNGMDVARRSRNMMVIDLYGLSLEEVKNRYHLLYQWIVDTVKEEREKKRDPAPKNNWWIFGRPRSNLREAISKINRYIVTLQVSRRSYFTFIEKNTIPDEKLIIFSSDDAYIIGVLSSKVHKAWIMASGGRHGVGNDLVYVKTLCFDAFPFPEATEAQKNRIRDLAEAIDAHRKQRQDQYPTLTLSEMYAVLEQMHYGVNLLPKERQIKDQGDLERLFTLHSSLDAAVMEAYGWPLTLSAEALLARLMELNKERAAEEKAGKVSWLRPQGQGAAVGSAEHGL